MFKKPCSVDREHVRLKYACPKCLKTSSETPTASSDTPSSHIVTAAKPAQPIDKGLPGPGLLAHVITSKYSDHLPLHRQEAMLARHGVELSRSTLADWMAASAELLTPLYKLMLAEVLKSRVVQTDETFTTPPTLGFPGRLRQGGDVPSHLKAVQPSRTTRAMSLPEQQRVVRC